MFGLFKSKSKGIPVVDKVWMSKQAKYNACAGMLDLQPTTVFVAWFEETLQELKAILPPETSTSVTLAAHIGPADTRGRLVVFVEHHPLPSSEQALFAKLGLSEGPVMSSLDEEFFMMFGGERTIELMKKLGMKDDEVVGNKMVARSIRRAQEKLESNCLSNNAAASQKEWIRKNIRGTSTR